MGPGHLILFTVTSRQRLARLGWDEAVLVLSPFRGLGVCVLSD